MTFWKLNHIEARNFHSNYACFIQFSLILSVSLSPQVECHTHLLVFSTTKCCFVFVWFFTFFLFPILSWTKCFTHCFSWREKCYVFICSESSLGVKKYAMSIIKMFARRNDMEFFLRSRLSVDFIMNLERFSGETWRIFMNF